MRFLHTSGKSTQGRMTYIHGDRAVDFESEDPAHRPDNHGPSAALIVDRTLQIEFRIDDGRLLYVWGYLPRESWKNDSGKLLLKEATPGMVFVKDVDDSVTTGVGYDTSLREVPTRYYKKSGHLVIGEPSDADELIEIATGTTLGLKGDQLVCVVLQPEMK